MNLGALLSFLKLAQDSGIIETKKTTTIFETIRPKKITPGTITVNLDPGVAWSYRERERTKKVLR